MKFNRILSVEPQKIVHKITTTFFHSPTSFGSLNHIRTFTHLTKSVPSEPIHLLTDWRLNPFATLQPVTTFSQRPATHMTEFLMIDNPFMTWSVIWDQQPNNCKSTGLNVSIVIHIICINSPAVNLIHLFFHKWQTEVKLQMIDGP